MYAFTVSLFGMWCLSFLLLNAIFNEILIKHIYLIHHQQRRWGSEMIGSLYTLQSHHYVHTHGAWQQTPQTAWKV